MLSATQLANDSYVISSNIETPWMVIEAKVGDAKPAGWVPFLTSTFFYSIIN